MMKLFIYNGNHYVLPSSRGSLFDPMNDDPAEAGNLGSSYTNPDDLGSGKFHLMSMIKCGHYQANDLK
jgi:hypothetical protein